MYGSKIGQRFEEITGLNYQSYLDQREAMSILGWGFDPKEQDCKFNFDQLEQIEAGLKLDIDMDFKIVTVTPEELADLQRGLEKEYGIKRAVTPSPGDPHHKEHTQSQAAGHGFTPRQAEMIEDARLLIPDNAVCRVIANPHLTPEQMQALTATACSHPGSMRDFYELSPRQHTVIQGEILDAVQQRAREFCKERFAEITGVSYDAAVGDYKEKSTVEYQSKIVDTGDLPYNSGQYEQIYEGIVTGVDVSQIMGQGYDALQMAEVRCGLASGVDVTQFADPAADYATMQKKRLELQRGKGKEVTPNVKDKLAAFQKSIDAKAHETSATRTNLSR
jgi:hypothetical protein